MPDGDTKFCKETRHSAAFSEHSHLHYHHPGTPISLSQTFPARFLPATEALGCGHPGAGADHPAEVLPASRAATVPFGPVSCWGSGRKAPACPSPAKALVFQLRRAQPTPSLVCPRSRWGPYHPQPAHPLERRGEETAPLAFISRGWLAEGPAETQLGAGMTGDGAGRAKISSINSKSQPRSEEPVCWESSRGQAAANGCDHQRVRLRRVTVTQLFSSGPPSPAASLPPNPCTLAPLPVCLIPLCSEPEAHRQGRAMGNLEPGLPAPWRSVLPAAPSSASSRRPTGSKGRLDAQLGKRAQCHRRQPPADGSKRSTYPQPRARVSSSGERERPGSGLAPSARLPAN